MIYNDTKTELAEGKRVLKSRKMLSIPQEVHENLQGHLDRIEKEGDAHGNKYRVTATSWVSVAIQEKIDSEQRKMK